MIRPEDMPSSYSDHHRFMHGLEPVRHEGPFKMFKRDCFMGTVPCFPVQSSSGMFDVRPGDFVPIERDGETVLEVRGMLGPGDFGCIKGFVPAAHLPASYSECGTLATAFDAATARGATRTQAMGAVIADALSPEMKGRS